MMNGKQIDLGAFLASQLHSAATSTWERIASEGLITSIAKLIRVEPRHEDIVPGSDWLKMAAFE